MKNRVLRWALFALALVFLFVSVFGTASVWTVGGFFAFGGAWYRLAWRKARELDAPRPR